MTMANREFTGEYMVPGASGERIEADHLARYHFAAERARGKRVLDIACGVGYASEIMMEAGAASYHGVDINEELVREASAAYVGDAISYSVGNVCDWAPGSTYDLICCFETIEHVKDFRAALKTLFSVAQDGATLLVSSPNRPVSSPRAKRLEDAPMNKFHEQEFRIEELKAELVRAGFVVGDGAVFGQRQRVHGFVRYANAALRRLGLPTFNPDQTASPAVTPVTLKSPRYFLIVAQKP